jgi:hypothetical protein
MNHHSFSVSPGLAPGRAPLRGRRLPANAENGPSPREGAWVPLRAEALFDQATRSRVGYSLHMPSQGRARLFWHRPARVRRCRGQILAGLPSRAVGVRGQPLTLPGIFLARRKQGVCDG